MGLGLEIPSKAHASEGASVVFTKMPAAFTGTLRLPVEASSYPERLLFGQRSAGLSLIK